jgi:hypothetical protein
MSFSVSSMPLKTSTPRTRRITVISVFHLFMAIENMEKERFSCHNYLAEPGATGGKG